MAWHLKGIAHSKLNQSSLADLSAAEEFLIRKDLAEASILLRRF